MGEKEFASPVSSRTTRDIGPVLPQERIDVVDILRGWAIFGMLVVNLTHDLPWAILFANVWPGTADRAAYFLVTFFANGKFYTLFSFLFGWGFTIQMTRAEARGAHFFPLYARRLFVLLLFGLMYKILGSAGQLIIYALLGYVLFLFRGRSLKTVLVTALLCLSRVLAYQIAVERIHENRLADSRTAQVAQTDGRESKESAGSEKELRLHSQGSFREIVVRHSRTVAADVASLDFYLNMLIG